jgi:branched-chain amino acid transport system permease protein
MNPLIADIQMPLWLALLVGGLLSALIAFLIGWPVLRLRGDYLAIATLGFSEIIRIVITNAQSWTNGALGIKDIPALNDVRYIFIATAITFLFVTCLINSSYGRAFKAIREDEIAAEAMGVGLFKHKCMAFMLSAFFAGIGGGLYATLLGTVDPKNFLFTLTYNFLLIIVLGGMGSITGSMLGSIIVTAGLEYLRVFDEPLELFGMAIPLFRPGFRMVIFSVLLMACVLFWRKGIMGTNEFTWEKFMAFCKNPVKYFTQKGAK